jgi:hypothetical protein
MHHGIFYILYFQLGRRRAKALPLLRSITEEQRKDIKRALDPLPGKYKASEWVSSDESDEEDGRKVFKKKIIEGRSEPLSACMAALDKLAATAAEKSGTCLFPRPQGTNVSKRRFGEDTPSWMIQ